MRKGIHMTSLSTLRHVAACAVVLMTVVLVPPKAAAGGPEMLSDILKEAKQKFAPDRRTVVFDIQPEPKGKIVVLRGEIHSIALKKELFAFLAQHKEFVFEDSIQTLPQALVGDRTRGVVSVSVANIRTKPDHAAEMATQAILGTPLQILKKDHGWYYVQTPDAYLGWTDDRVEMMTPALFDAWSAKPKVIVTTEIAFLHKSEDPASDVIGDVVAGGLLGFAGETEGSFAVEFPDGRTATLPRSMGKPYTEWLSAAAATPENILATARRFVGVPYLWGGTSAKGMDCSGFIKTVFFLNGVLMPRDASQQAAVGESVDTTGGVDLKPGDLLFFGFKGTADRRERVTHVAISLGGKRFIHASTDVRVNSIAPVDTDYSQHREQMFLRARRVIGASAATGVISLKDIPYYGGGRE
jgi:gamma-D-glutamyl-L-lysine dipeptidyl-peptidase